MALIPVTQYQLSFDPALNKGIIDVQMSDGSHGQLPINTIEEQTLILLMLSKPGIMFDNITKRFGFTWRPAGT